MLRATMRATKGGAYRPIGAMHAMIAVVVGLAGCASRGASVQAPIDVAVTPVGGVAPPPVTSDTGRANGTCSLRLVASPIEKSAAGCYLDEHISEGPGMLTFPCSGDGAAEAVFGEQHYTGHVEHGELELVSSSELDWEDGCHWGTRGTISGALGGPDHAPRRLDWHYLDRVITGSNCSGVCRAKAVIHVTPASGKHVGGGASDDEPDED